MHVRSLLAGVGIAAVAVTVPLVVASTASAEPSSTTASTCPRIAVHQEVQQYLAAHPDVAAQLKTFRQDRRGSWAEVAGAAAAQLDEYPAVKAMVEQLGQTPAGQRADAAKQYLADHPDAQAQLKQLRAANRTRVQSCRGGK